MLRTLRILRAIDLPVNHVGHHHRLAKRPKINCIRPLYFYDTLLHNQNFTSHITFVDSLWIFQSYFSVPSKNPRFSTFSTEINADCKNKFQSFWKNRVNLPETRFLIFFSVQLIFQINVKFPYLLIIDFAKTLVSLFVHLPVRLI